MSEQEQARWDALLAAFEVLTAYLVDHCPDGVMWEDFDPGVDGLRMLIDEEMTPKK